MLRAEDFAVREIEEAVHTAEGSSEDVALSLTKFALGIALLTGARGEDIAYRNLVDRYRTMAKSLGFEGHIAMAEVM